MLVTLTPTGKSVLTTPLLDRNSNCGRAVVAITLVVATQLSAQKGIGPTSTVEGRPIIVLVHGRNQMYKDEVELDTVWVRALRSGLKSAGLDGLVQREDLRVVRYAQVFERGYTVSPLCVGRKAPPGTALAMAYEGELEQILVAAGNPAGSSALLELFPEGVRTELFGQPNVQAMQPLSLPGERARQITLSQQVTAVDEKYAEQLKALSADEQQRALDFGGIVRWFRDQFAKVLAPGLVVRFTADTEAYLRIDATTCETDEIIRAAFREARLAQRPLVVVSHSMGAMVTYRVMATQPPLDRFTVSAYFTLGAQLGWPKIPPYLLGTGAGAGKAFRWPDDTNVWVNLHGTNDPLAFTVGERFGATSGRPWVDDVEIKTGNLKVAHDVVNYLGDPFVAQRIAAAWCRAFAAPAAPPPACRAAAVFGASRE
jgi:hypothetical protein